MRGWALTLDRIPRYAQRLLLLEHWRQASWCAGILGLIATIALADYAAGIELNLSILYLVPLFLAAWCTTLPAALALAFAATVAWLVSDFYGEVPYSHTLYHVWEGAIRLGTWTLFIALLHRMKIALAHADERFVTMVESLEAAVYVADPRTRKLLYTNAQCRKAFGGALTHTRDIERCLQTAPHAGSPSRPERYDPGADAWYLVASRRIRWTDGRSVELHLATDISACKRAETLARTQQEKLQMTARLIALGEMGAALAHEVNQPLAAIGNYVTGCARRLRSGVWSPHDLLHALDKSAEQVERAGHIVHRVREFVKKRAPRLVPCDVNAVIQDIAAMMQTEVERRGVTVRLELASPLPVVPADRVMMEQVLMNLMQNAMQAMEDAGGGRAELTVSSGVDAKGMVHVQVADRGPGLPAPVAAHLFTPFFTTKAEGLGLGLPICRSIVELHAGRMWTSENPGGGAIVHFALPAVSP